MRTREEAIVKGVELHDVQHSMKRRPMWHDYSQRGTYMLTMVVQDRRPLLGTLAERLLQISPWEYHMDRKTIARQQCLQLNAMAEAIVKSF